jgi:hypothetical protein
MTVQRTSNLLVAATFIGGLLAGGNVDRAFVAMPAWEHVGAIAWGQFSRHADLGNRLVLYADTLKRVRALAQELGG